MSLFLEIKNLVDSLQPQKGSKAVTTKVDKRVQKLTTKVNQKVQKLRLQEL